MIKVDDTEWKIGDLLSLLKLVKIEADKAELRNEEEQMLMWARIYKALDNADDEE